MKKEEVTKEAVNKTDIPDSPVVKEDEEKSSKPSKWKQKLTLIELLHVGEKKKV